MTNTILQGDVREKLKEIPHESVDCCVTSPPYWGLRDYKLPDIIWGENNCEHKWEVKEKAIREGIGGTGTRWQHQEAHDIGPDEYDISRCRESEKKRKQIGFCLKCSAWRGSLGLEPTPELYVQHLVEIFREVKRVLKKEGTVWLNLGDSYAGSMRGYNPKGTKNWVKSELQKGNRGSFVQPPDWSLTGLKSKDLIGIPWHVVFALQAEGWWLRSDIIWSKPNPMPESVTDRPTKSHEYIFLLSKSASYYFDQKAVREPYQTFENRPAGVIRNREYGYKGKYQVMPPIGGIKQSEGNKNPTYSGNQPNWKEGRNLRSVWHIPTQPFKGAHFATFPEKLIEPCIKAGCPKDGIVLDPFLGSGTTAVVAKKLGRNWIGIELNPDYVKMAERRIANTMGRLI